MNCLVINGSPRGKNGNSAIILDWFIKGIKEQVSTEPEIIYLNQISKHDSYIDKILINDAILLIFPLYTDSMPGLVMAFFEKLEALKGKLVGKKIGFIVHSGFPEACHSRAVEKYLCHLAFLLGAHYSGTIVMGGSEGIKTTQGKALEKRSQAFNRLGRIFINDSSFPEPLIKEIAGAERYPKFVLFILSLLCRLGVINSYWDKELKKNNAYKRRSDKPYL